MCVQHHKQMLLSLRFSETVYWDWQEIAAEWSARILIFPDKYAVESECESECLGPLCINDSFSAQVITHPGGEKGFEY